MLLAAAGLLIESFVKLQRIDPGFSYAGLTTLETTLPPANFAEPLTLARFLSTADQNIAGLPQVNSVTAMSGFPPSPL